MTFLNMISHEWKTRLSQPASLFMLGLFCIAMAYGAISGDMQQDRRQLAIDRHQADVSTRMDKWLNDLEALQKHGAESGVPAWSGSAMDYSFSSYLAPGQLGDFAIGQSDLLPGTGEISLWNPDYRLFAKYEFDDPVSLSLGRFDLSKCIILILPLLLIVLCFDILSSERDSQRLGLSVAQGASIRAMFWQRLMIRAGLILGLSFVISCLALTFQGGAFTLIERLPFFVFWILCTFLYAMCWIAIISLVSCNKHRSEVNMTRLLLLWAGFILIVPACVTSITEMVYPSPSRLEYLSEAREMENSVQLAEADVANRFIMDHPEMLIDETSQIPDYVRTAFFVTSSVDQATRPIREAFDQAARQREYSLQLIQYLSPAIMIHRLFNEIAGSSSKHHRQYIQQARNLKSSYAALVGPHIVAGERLSPSLLEQLPEIQQPQANALNLMQQNLYGLVFLLAISVFLLVIADQRLKHHLSVL